MGFVLLLFATLCTLCNLAWCILFSWLLTLVPEIGWTGWLLLAPVSVLYALLFLALALSAARLNSVAQANILGLQQPGRFEAVWDRLQVVENTLNSQKFQSDRSDLIPHLLQQ